MFGFFNRKSTTTKTSGTEESSMTQPFDPDFKLDVTYKIEEVNNGEVSFYYCWYKFKEEPPTKWVPVDLSPLAVFDNLRPATHTSFKEAMDVINKDKHERYRTWLRRKKAYRKEYIVE